MTIVALFTSLHDRYIFTDTYRDRYIFTSARAVLPKVRLIVLWAVRGCHSCFVNCRSASPDNCKLTLRKRTIRTEDKPGRFFHEFRHLRKSALVINFINSLKLDRREQFGPTCFSINPIGTFHIRRTKYQRFRVRFIVSSFHRAYSFRLPRLWPDMSECHIDV